MKNIGNHCYRQSLINMEGRNLNFTSTCFPDRESLGGTTFKVDVLEADLKPRA